MARKPSYSDEQFKEYCELRDKGVTAKDAAEKIGLANFQSIEKTRKKAKGITSTPRGTRATAKASAAIKLPVLDDPDDVAFFERYRQKKAKITMYKQQAVSVIEFAVRQINRLKEDADKIIANLEARQREIMGVKDEEEVGGTDGDGDSK